MSDTIMKMPVKSSGTQTAYIELFLSNRKNKANEDVTVYNVTYLTPADPICDQYDCHNTESYLELEEARTAFGTRILSDNPKNQNPGYNPLEI